MSEPENTPAKKTERLDLLKFPMFGWRGKSRTNQKYATLNRRMMAATIDSLLLMFFGPVFQYLVPVNTGALQGFKLDQNDPEAPGHLLMYMLTNQDFMMSWANNLLAQMGFLCFFSAVCWHFWSATPGKMLLRIKIVDAKTEAPITDTQIFFRVIGYVISAMPFMFGFWWIFFSKRRQAWHDLLAGTVVVVIPWRLPKKKEEPVPAVEQPQPGDDLIQELPKL